MYSLEKETSLKIWVLQDCASVSSIDIKKYDNMKDKWFKEIRNGHLE